MTIRWGLLGCGVIAHKRVARALIAKGNAKTRIFLALATCL
jgi:predicted dehydrogenase